MRDTRLEKLCSSWEERAQVILSKCNKSPEPDEKMELEHLAAIGKDTFIEVRNRFLLNHAVW